MQNFFIWKKRNLQKVFDGEVSEANQEKDD